MDNKANISFCLIVRNEEKNIEQCLSSIRPYVEELVILDTGSTDGTIDIVKKYADIFEVYTDCNGPDGKIEDFSKARNKAMSLCTKEWFGWMDADDIIVGAEKLKPLIENLSKNDGIPVSVLLPYEYSHDQNDNVNCILHRERLVYPVSKFKWHSPVHEVMMGPENSPLPLICDDIKMVHRRTKYGKVTDPNRNLRIIKKYVDQIGESDPRQLYYLGLEYGNTGDIENAIKTLTRYTELTGWEDEKCLAELKISDHYLSFGDFTKSIEWATKSIHTKESWCQPYFQLGRLYYFLAESAEKEGKSSIRLWEKCVNFIKIGLNLPETKTLLFISPLEREVEIHRFFNFALNKTGDVYSALLSVNTALEKYPNDESFLGNKRIYEDAISKIIITKELDKLKNNNSINNDIKDSIVNMLDKKKVQKEELMINWKPYYRNEEYPRNVKESDFPVAEITPHAQAWGIPETFVYDDLPLKNTDSQLQAMIGAIWKELMLHDEVLSAISLLENAPYRIKHSPETEDLLKKTKACIAWISDPAEYDKDNTPQDPNGNPLSGEMCPLPYPLGGQAQMRMQWMTDRIPDKSKKLLDMACIDGEMTNRWGLSGYNVVGIDCCTNSIRIANEKAIEHNTGAKHIQTYFDKAPEVLSGQKFDYITCGDVYEHLIDPVKDLLRPARQLIAEDGKMVLVTPHGAWFRGQFAAHAHPWLWANEGLPWNAVKNRGHIIAPTVWTVADNFRKAGWWVKDCTVVAQWQQDVKDQSNVCVEAYPVAPGDSANKKDIVIYLGDGLENWTFHTVDITGTGGSELAAINMSKELVKQGHRVRMYFSCGEWGEGIYDGVECYKTAKFNSINCDILIVSRDATALDPSLNVKAKSKILWTHDIYPKGLTHELSLQADRIFVLCEWHKKFMMDSFPFLPEEQLFVTQNGLDLNRFDISVQRDPHSIIYSSSPDRGLPVLLKVWGKIREQVPDAKLNVFYGFDNWMKSAGNDQNQINLINSLIEEMKRLEPMGVNYHGRVNQNTLAKEFLSAGAWLYPTFWTETSCISAMEAQMAGLAMVTSPIAALNETAGDRAVMIEGDWLSDSYQESFTQESIKALLHTSDEKRQLLTSYAKENFDWVKVAKSWDSLFDTLLSDELYILPYKK